MRYYKNENSIIATIGALDLPEITAEEYEAEMAAINKRMAEQAEAQAKVDELRHRITELKAQLAAMDYKALKYMEGWLTDEEYAPIRAERQAIRDEINALESAL